MFKLTPKQKKNLNDNFYALISYLFLSGIIITHNKTPIYIHMLHYRQVRGRTNTWALNPKSN
jgi:hypothetical protein